jgi:hypothetical protein
LNPARDVLPLCFRPSMLDATDLSIFFFDLYQNLPSFPNRRLVTKDCAQPWVICRALEQGCGYLMVPAGALERKIQAHRVKFAYGK